MDAKSGTLRPEWIAPLMVSALAAIIFHALGHDPFTRLYGAGDGYTASLPSKVFAATFSSWNPWVQLGQYTYQDVQYQPFYLPGLLVMRLWPSTFSYNTFILAHYAAAGVLGYLFLRNLRLSRFAALFGGLCFESSGFLSGHLGHTAMVCAATWLPLMLWAVDRFFDSRSVRHLAAGALAVGMSLLAGFPQVTLYAMMLTAVYAGWRASMIDGWSAMARLRGLGVTLAIVLGLGVVVAAIQIVPVVASLPQITRDQLTYTAFSEDAFPLQSLLCFIVPNLFGGMFQVADYATNLHVVEIYPYMGLLPLALAVGAAYACAPVFRDTRFWTGTALAALILSLGPATPLHPLLFHVPVYNLFRAPARHLFELNFAICVLAAVAVDTLESSTPADIRRRLVRWAAGGLTAAFITAMVASQALAAAAHFVDTIDNAAVRSVQINPLFTAGRISPYIEDNLRPASPTIFLPAAFLVLSLACVWWLWRAPRRWAARLAVLVVIAGDLGVVGASIYTYPDTTRAFHPLTVEEVAVIKARGYDVTRDRVYPLEPELIYTYPVLNILSGVSVINGYTPAWMKRYQYFSGFSLNGVRDPERMADTGFLAVTSAKYLLARSAYWRALLLVPTAPRGTKSNVAARPSAADWTVLDATSVDAGLTLRAASAKGLSLAKTPLSLQPNTFYLVKFDARAADGLAGTLVADFQASNYDNALQDRTLYALPRDFSEQSLVIDAGPDAPAEAALRFYTSSTSPIEIRHVSVATLGPSVPSPFEEVATTADGISVFVNHNALPRFRFATTLVPVADTVEARKRFEEPDFDYSSAVTVEGLREPQTVEPGQILSQTIENTALRWRIRSGARSFFVVGDTFFPGWSATVDGRPVPIYATDGFLRGVFVDGSGEHDVEMAFRPEKFSLGVAATASGIVTLVIIWFGGLRRRARLASHQSGLI